MYTHFITNVKSSIIKPLFKKNDNKLVTIIDQYHLFPE